jgi:antitoxin YefM
MLQTIKTITTVNQNGAINIYSPELPIGETVEVIILIQPKKQDTTDYLLSNPANKRHLLQAVEELNNPANYTYLDIEAL